MSERNDFIAGLREIANWYEAHPEIAAPDCPCLDNYSVNSKEVAAAVIRGLGKCEKEYSESLLKIARDFGPIRHTFYFYRQDVCRKVVVGTKEIPEQVIPAQPEKVIPARVEEITKWECDPIIAPEREAA